jgi:hypothetical protein
VQRDAESVKIGEREDAADKGFASGGIWDRYDSDSIIQHERGSVWIHAGNSVRRSERTEHELLSLDSQVGPCITSPVYLP